MVVNSASASVQRFDPVTFEQGPLGTPISVDLRPTAIAAGEGAIWVANTGADTVTRIDPGNAGAAPTTESIRVGDTPAGLAVGAGSVWVANASDGTVLADRRRQTGGDRHDRGRQRALRDRVW